MVKLSVAFLWGTLCLCVTVEVALSSSIDVLKEAAMKWQGPLVCEDWDCDCALTRRGDCCCAANDMFDLEEKTFKRMVSLWHQKKKLDMVLAPLTENVQVAFKACINPILYRDKCIGPFNTDMTIPYSLVTLNHGNGFNPALAVFTAPRAGLYLFSVTVYSHVQSEHRLYHKVALMKNGTPVASMWEDNREDSQDSSTQVVLLELERGCQVYVKLVSGRWLCNHFRVQDNIFTGYLVYPY